MLLIHGILVLHNVPFCLVHEEAGAPWVIYTGIPVLAHLGVLPSQTLDQYVSGEKHVDCFNIPLFFDRKASEMVKAVKRVAVTDQQPIVPQPADPELLNALS